jgi:dihydroorotase
MKILIKHARIVNEGRTVRGSVVIEGDTIRQVLEGDGPTEGKVKDYDEVIDAEWRYLLPGVIDDHVHFRDPGLTHKADIHTESMAAAAGGVTSYMDMPNCVPQTTTLEALAAKQEDAARKSVVNYSFYFGVTNDNADQLHLLDPRHVCGIKLFMGSSTGNMLVDDADALRRIFREAPMLIAAHCEDSAIIARNAAHYKELYGDDPDVKYHPLIRSTEACLASSRLAVELARETGARLHILHVSTADELPLFEDRPLTDPHSAVSKRITAEACVAHLFFSADDYAQKGTRIKCNPAIKESRHRDALRQALASHRIDVIGTDHAPHLLSEKQGGALKAVSGMPMIQFSLVTMMELVREGVLTIEQLVEKMCHAPATLYEVAARGFIRPGYKADLVLVDPASAWTVTAADVVSKCGWSPLEGTTLHARVLRTWVNGQTVYSADRGVDEHVRGEALEFER